MPVVDVNGARLWYDEAGNGQTVLLLHGGLGDSGLWEPVVPLLAQRFRTIRMDLRFYGSSTGPAVPWSWQDDVVGVLDALEIERAALAGHARDRSARRARGARRAAPRARLRPLPDATRARAPVAHALGVPRCGGAAGIERRRPGARGRHRSRRRPTSTGSRSSDRRCP